MEIVALQDEIVGRIQEAVDDTMAEVIVMPDNDNDFERPKQKKGKIVVGYQSSDFSDTLTMGPVAQVEKVMVIITIQSRTLYGENGVYTLLPKIKSKVLGYRPADCDAPLKAKYFGPPESYTKPKVDDCWTFEYHVETRAPYIQDAEYDDVIVGTAIDPETEEQILPNDAELVVPTEEGELKNNFDNLGPIALITFNEA